MRTTLAAAALLLIGAACSKTESKPAEQAVATPTAPNVVTFTTREYAIEGPDTIPSGMTTLVLNDAGAMLHHVQLLRLKDGKTLADFEAGAKSMKPTDPMPSWVEAAGGVNTPNPGGRSEATLDIPPGNYIAICLVDVPDHVPHFTKGMLKALTVTPSAAPAAPAPTADVMLTLSDYAFGFSTPLTAGHHVIKVDNTATQPHEFVLFRLKPGKTMDDVGKFAATYKGEIPVEGVGGVPAMAPGQSQYVTFDLTPGDYVAVCFISDAKDHKPHTEHGMVLPIKIG